MNPPRTKTGFHWKTLEKKPSDWETLRILIQDGCSSSSSTEILRDPSWDHFPIIMTQFLRLYPQIKSWFPSMNLDEHPKIKETKSKKKVSISKKQEIQSRVLEEKFRKDLEGIRFEGKTFTPLKTRFQTEPSFFLSILLWTYVIMETPFTNEMCKSRLDAIISFFRLYKEYRQEMEQSFTVLVQDMDKIRDRIQRSITEKTYEHLFHFPVLLVRATSERRRKCLRLYPTQHQILDLCHNSVREDSALLLGNQMPTGLGKTFLVVPLAKRLAREHKTVLFMCSNELVNHDVASTALVADDLHLWMAKLILLEGQSKPVVLLRPHKRCFPSVWKQVYRKDAGEKIGSVADQWGFYIRATGKPPDLIVADLEAGTALLREADKIKNPFLAYIDEFISDSASNLRMAEICKYLPRQTVLLSSILPLFSDMPVIVHSFRHRHGLTKVSDESWLHRVSASEVNISCAVIDPTGRLRMPHHHCVTVEDLDRLCKDLEVNPRLRRMYTARHVYFWAKELRPYLPECLYFSNMFPDIGEITNNNILSYAQMILKQAITDPIVFQHMKEYRPVLIPEGVIMSRMFCERASFYEGQTLVISDHMISDLEDMQGDLLEGVSWSQIMAQIRRTETALSMSEERLQRSKMSLVEKQRQLSETMSESIIPKLPALHVINSREHFLRYHPLETHVPSFVSRSAVELPPVFDTSFDEETNLRLAAGAGLYDCSIMTEFQRNLVMGIYDQLGFLCSGRDIVFGTNLPGLTNIVIEKDFAEKESISTLYQLMGRAGRMGKSFCASILLHSEKGVQKLMSLGSNLAVDENIDSLFSSSSS